MHFKNISPSTLNIKVLILTPMEYVLIILRYLPTGRNFWLQAFQTDHGETC